MKSITINPTKKLYVSLFARIINYLNDLDKCIAECPEFKEAAIDATRKSFLL